MPVNILGLTTAVRAKLYQGQPGTTVATVYTAPASTDVKVTSIVLCNTTAAAATVSISIVTAAGTAGAANRIVDTMQVGARETVALDTPVHMGPADFIAALQGTASAVTLTISGETYA